LPGINDLLALLNALKTQVQDGVAREARLGSDYRLQTAAELRDFASRSEAQELAAHQLLAEATAVLQSEQGQSQERFLRRKAWLNRIHSAMSKRVFAAISEADAQWKERTQQGLQDAERFRDESLAAAAAAHENFQLRLGEAAEALALLESSVSSAFRGYGKFRRLLAPAQPVPEPALPADHQALFAELQSLLEKIRAARARFARLPLPLLFRFLPVWALAGALLALAAADPVGRHFGRPLVADATAVVALGGAVLAALLHFVGGRLAAPAARTLAGDVAGARRRLAASQEKSAAFYEHEQARIRNEFTETKQNFNQEWRQAVRDLSARRGEAPAAVDSKAGRAARINEGQHQARLERIQQRHAAAVAQLKAADLAQVRQLTQAHEARTAQIESAHQQRWLELAADWRRQIDPLCAQLSAIQVAAEKLFPAWDSVAWKDWAPPAKFYNAAKFARLEGPVESFVGALPQDPRLAWPGPQTLSAPLALAYPHQGSILFESGQTGGDEAIAVINNIIFRLLATTPPGKLSFTIFDPVGLGQNFAALTHLTDYEDSSLSSRIWTQPAQFEEKLAELNEHMEKVIQMYLRNEYATIADYNAEAGSVAEKYHILIIASFPVNFTETAAKRLRNIAASGARCGVFTLIHWDQRNPLPADFVPDELRKNSVNWVRTARGFELPGGLMPGGQLFFDPPPSSELATDFLQRVGELSRHASRVEVPFASVAPADADMWQEETTEQLRVPIGRSGATKFQWLEIGSGTRQHALIAGKTGSGKSTLFHVIITNLALRCSPEQVEFYLVDFKKGVEFKCYGARRLPHARVVAIESDREFGLSVLQRVDEELRRRGDLFRRQGAQDLAGYQRSGGREPVPRTLLMIDEFQEFFTEEDRVSQGAAVLLDRIVRQGRAFGIHVLLGSQTLGGAYTLARATLGQMVIRIALQCNEADAYLIMDQDNPAPRLLSRPGEGIYNDAAGALEGNSPFQAVWISDRTRDEYLAKIRARADQARQPYPGPIVFEGNAPADVRENELLRHVLQQPATQIPQSATLWLGAPNAIKGPTECVFKRQSGSHLLVIGQSEERTATLLTVALVALAAQYPKDAAQFLILDSTPQGFPQREMLDTLIQGLPQRTVAAANGNLAEAMTNLAEQLKQRTDDEAAGPEIFVLIQGLQNFKKLRAEDEFSFASSTGDAPQPAAILSSLITEGPARGIHLLLTCDTYNNLSRFLGRKALSEFEMRVVFQMSATDSASLIDAPAAATLGLHRALLYNDREGSLETFRPYAPPDGDWLESVTQALNPAPQ
jgi:hypothetical protein